MLKKMLWEMGTCSRLPQRLIGDGRDSAKRVVSDTDPPKVLPKSLQIVVKEAEDAGEEVLAVGEAGDAVLLAGVDLHVEIDSGVD